jgi:cob(I)alamin adenosyltransferase
VVANVPSIIPDTLVANGRDLPSRVNGCKADQRRIEQGMTVKIYTKTGDDGMTGLLGSHRVSKDDVRIEAYGTVDELNAVLGVARAHGLGSAADALVARVQNELFIVGSALADAASDGPFHNAIADENVSYLETTIDALETELEPLTHFILPGGSLPAAHIHLARTVCRRAERLTVELSRRPGEDVSKSLIIYLNRLSDLLFVLARAVNLRAGVADILWKGLDRGGTDHRS